MLDFSEDAQTAVEQPRIHAGQLPETIEVEPSVPLESVTALEALGWKTKLRSMYSPLCMIVLDSEQRPQPLIDPRGGGGAWPAS
jgi:gamma-glutamyltranspeptidase